MKFLRLASGRLGWLFTELAKIGDPSGLRAALAGLEFVAMPADKPGTSDSRSQHAAQLYPALALPYSNFQ